jgi:LysM repeat protein
MTLQPFFKLGAVLVASGAFPGIADSRPAGFDSLTELNPVEAPLVQSLPAANPTKLWAKVRIGITIQDLASQLGIQPEALADLNDVEAEHRLKGGDWVMLPAQKAQRAKQLASLDASGLRRSAPQTTPPPLETTGVVRLGDNLRKLALRYGMSLQDLLRQNPGLQAADLVAGTQIRVANAAPVRNRQVLGLNPVGSGGLSWPELPRFGRQPKAGSLAELRDPTGPPAPAQTAPATAEAKPVLSAPSSLPPAAGAPPTTLPPAPSPRTIQSVAGDPPAVRRPDPSLLRLSAPQSFDRALDQLVLDGTVSPEERARVRSASALQPGDPISHRRACVAGALTSEECRAEVVRWPGDSRGAAGFNEPQTPSIPPDWRTYGRLRVAWGRWKRQSNGMRVADARGGANAIAVDCHMLRVSLRKGNTWSAYYPAENYIAKIVFDLCDNADIPVAGNP